MLELFIPIVIALIIYLLVKYYWTCFQSPPGPYGIPGLGIIPTVIAKAISTGKTTVFRDIVNEIGERHRSAGVISFCMGTQRFVFLHTYDAIKEALVDNAQVFSSRPIFQFVALLGKEPNGIIFSDGQQWKIHRRFSLTVLRNLGFGKSLLEGKVIEESKELNKRIRFETPQGQLNTMDYFVRAIGNVISQLLLGTRWEYDSEEFNYLYHHVKVTTQSDSMLQNLQLFYPQIAPSGIIPFLFPTSRNIVTSDRAIEKLMEEKYEAIAQNYDGFSEPNCYVEAFIKEANENASKGDQNSFTRQQCVRAMLDLITAGTDTTTNSLAWAIIYLAKYPNALMKLQKEIDETVENKFHNVGGWKTKEDVELLYSDRAVMPYTSAVMDEVQRCASIVFHSVEHSVAQPVKFRGYQIHPKDIVLYNIVHVHHDRQLWGNDVDLFRPERFLDESGKNYKPSKYLMPFGVGKRSCLGEGLARVEFFVFLTGLCREFNWKLSSNTKATLDDLIDGGSEGVVKAPPEHEMVFTPRASLIQRKK